MNYSNIKNICLSLILLIFLLLVYVLLIFLVSHFYQNEKSVIGTINLDELADFGNMIVNFTEIFLILSMLSLFCVMSIKPIFRKCILYTIYILVVLILYFFIFEINTVLNK